jgi:hypothetical protein
VLQLVTASQTEYHCTTGHDFTGPQTVAVHTVVADKLQPRVPLNHAHSNVPVGLLQVQLLNHLIFPSLRLPATTHWLPAPLRWTAMLVVTLVAGQTIIP